MRPGVIYACISLNRHSFWNGSFNFVIGVWAYTSILYARNSSLELSLKKKKEKSISRVVFALLFALLYFSIMYVAVVWWYQTLYDVEIINVNEYIILTTAFFSWFCSFFLHWWHSCPLPAELQLGDLTSAFSFNGQSGFFGLVFVIFIASFCLCYMCLVLLYHNYL